MKKIITLCLLAFIGTTQVNAQCNFGNNELNGSGAIQLSVFPYVYQSFTAECSGVVNYIDVKTLPNASMTIQFILQEGDGNTGALLRNENYTINSFGFFNGEDIFRIPLYVPVPVTSGSVYTFAIHCIGGTPSSLFHNNTNPYLGGSLYTYRSASGFQNYSGLDLEFRVNTVSSCTSTSSTTNLSICPSALPYSWNGLTFNTVGSQTKTLTNAAGCDSLATLNLTLKPSPAIGTSSISGALCSLGATRTLYNTNTSGGGVWSSSNPKIAPVSTPNGASGTVLCDGSGTITLTYTKTGSNGCKSAASITVLMTPVKTPAVIAGASSICVGAATTYSSATTGGMWASGNNKLSINPTTGVATGSNIGAGIITYTVSAANGCTASANYNVTVNGIPGVPSITYAPGTPNPQYGAGSNYCTNRNFTVLGSPTGGVWSSTGVLTVNANTGAVATGNTPGAASLTYTTTVNDCSNSRSIAATVIGCAARGVAISNEQLVSSNGFAMYPNPAKTFIRLNVETLVGAGSIVVTDLYGKTVKTQSLSMGTNTVDIAKLSKGMYFVSTITSEGKTTKKLVVE